MGPPNKIKIHHLNKINTINMKILNFMRKKKIQSDKILLFKQPKKKHKRYHYNPTRSKPPSESASPDTSPESAEAK